LSLNDYLNTCVALHGVYPEPGNEILRCAQDDTRRGQGEQLIDYRFMESRNFLLVFVPEILSSRNSMASMVPSGLSTLRSIHIVLSRSRSTRSSSFRVPDDAISIAGKTRLSARRRSRCTSILPVPLNASKITSSMRLPVSTKAVAMIVKLPPSSMLRAAPKNRLGRCSALESKPPERTLPLGGAIVL